LSFIGSPRYFFGQKNYNTENLEAHTFCIKNLLLQEPPSSKNIGIGQKIGGEIIKRDREKKLNHLSILVI
jgi:hypothetical protein